MRLRRYCVQKLNAANTLISADSRPALEIAIDIAPKANLRFERASSDQNLSGTTAVNLRAIP